MSARYYDSGTGRFLSEDPIGLIPDENQFRYVRSNSIIRFDPLGLYKQLPEGGGGYGPPLIIGVGVGIGIIAFDPKCPKQEDKNPRQDEIDKCNEAKARILDECTRGEHSGLICEAQKLKLCL